MPRETAPVLRKLLTKCNEIALHAVHVHGTATWPCSPVTYWQSPQGSQSVRVFCSRMLSNPYRYIYSLTFRFLTVPDHPELSTVSGKMQVCTVGNSEPLASYLKCATWEIWPLSVNDTRSLWRSNSSASSYIRWPTLSMACIPLLLSNTDCWCVW